MLKIGVACLLYFASVIVLGIFGTLVFGDDARDLANFFNSSYWRPFLTGLFGLVFAVSLVILKDYKETIERKLKTLGGNVSDLGDKIETGISKIENRVNRLKKFERIITGQDSQHDPKNYLLVAVSPFVDEELPCPLPLKSKGEKWKRSISVLIGDTLQDSLFSSKYIQHFFSLEKHCEVDGINRILILDKGMRYKEAIAAFLTLSIQAGITTSVIEDVEFQGVLDLCSELNLGGHSFQKILQSNPDFTCMEEAPRAEMPQDSPFLIRLGNERVHHLSNCIKSVGPDNVPQIEWDKDVTCLYQVLAAGVETGKIYCKKTVPEGLIKPNEINFSENSWSESIRDHLAGSGKRV